MRLASVLVNLHHSKGREALGTFLVLAYTCINAPSGGAAGLANGAEGLLRMKVAVSGVQGDPVDEVIWGLKPPARHDEALLHTGYIPQSVGCWH